MLCIYPKTHVILCSLLVIQIYFIVSVTWCKRLHLLVIDYVCDAAGYARTIDLSLKGTCPGLKS